MSEERGRYSDEDLDKAIDNQPIEGLLYDLDLLPEQVGYGVDFDRMQIVERLYKRMKKAEAPHA